MASWNPFSSREKQALDSTHRETQRSEAPTGAIEKFEKLSSKVRNMVNAVATRVR